MHNHCDNSIFVRMMKLKFTPFRVKMYGRRVATSEVSNSKACNRNGTQKTVMCRSKSHRIAHPRPNTLGNIVGCSSYCGQLLTQRWAARFPFFRLFFWNRDYIGQNIFLYIFNGRDHSFSGFSNRQTGFLNNRSLLWVWRSGVSPPFLGDHLFRFAIIAKYRVHRFGSPRRALLRKSHSNLQYPLSNARFNITLSFNETWTLLTYLLTYELILISFPFSILSYFHQVIVLWKLFPSFPSFPSSPSSPESVDSFDCIDISSSLFVHHHIYSTKYQIIKELCRLKYTLISHIRDKRDRWKNYDRWKQVHFQEFKFRKSFLPSFLG